MSKDSLSKGSQMRTNDEISSFSGKEMALHYLKRNQDSSSPFNRNNSMLKNQMNYDDFKNELLNCINVPECFKKKNNQEKSELKTCKSLSKSANKDLISKSNSI